MSGVQLDDKHTQKDWGLYWTGTKIESPEAQTNKIKIPGRDGTLDLTEGLYGSVKYENRQLTFTFMLDERKVNKWHSLYSEIANHCHGKIMKVILDTEPDYYYLGRVDFTSDKSERTGSDYTITVDAEPYKYDVISTMEDWEWDCFNFMTGIIQKFKNLTVDGTLTLSITGKRKQVLPIFQTSSQMTVTFNGITYTLPAGKSQILGIVIKEGNNNLTIKGNGTISIDYRGGSL